MPIKKKWQRIVDERLCYKRINCINLNEIWTLDWVMFNVIVDVVCLCECLCATACCACAYAASASLYMLSLLVLVQLIACLPLFCSTFTYLQPSTNQYTSQFVSRLCQQQQQIAVQQYKIRARVKDRDQYFTFTFARHQIFQAQIEAGQTLFVYLISVFFAQ